jgi:hypothetical protein
MKLGVLAILLLSAIGFAVSGNAAPTFKQRCSEEHGEYRSGETDGSRWEQCRFPTPPIGDTPKVYLSPAFKLCKEFSGQVHSNTRRSSCTIRHD